MAAVVELLMEEEEEVAEEEAIIIDATTVMTAKCMYSKTCLKRPFKNGQNKDLNE